MWLALISLGGLGIVLATILAIAYTKLAVKVSEKKKRPLLLYLALIAVLVDFRVVRDMLRHW